VGSGEWGVGSGEWGVIYFSLFCKERIRVRSILPKDSHCFKTGCIA
jgi:hypothetical protein